MIPWKDCPREVQVAFTAGRHAAVKLWPYMADAIYILLPQIVEGQVVAVDARARLSIGLEFLQPPKGKPPSTTEVAYTIGHEAEHIIREHHRRGEVLIALSHVGPNDPQALARARWRCNVAADMEINQHHPGSLTPTQERASCPDWAYPERYDLPRGKTMEWYYHNLPEEIGEGNGDGEGEGDLSFEVPAADAGENEVVGRSALDLDQVRRNVATAIATQGVAGNAPGDLLRWAESVLSPPVVPWWQALRSGLKAAGQRRRGFSHYTYAKMARRQAGLGYGPGSPRLPRAYTFDPLVDLVIDTSASMGELDLGTVMAQVEPLFRTGARARVWASDTQISASDTVRSLREAAALLKGGGGTDFRPVLNHLAGLPRAQRSGGVFFFTDGGGEAPPVNPLPGTPLFWVLIGHQAVMPRTERGKPIDYGTVIKVPPVVS